MRCVVTGAAGFIGSHLCELLLAQGEHVTGVDALTSYYDPRRKQANVRDVEGHERFTFLRADLCDLRLDELLDGADVVYHLAGQPGVRPSWGSDFGTYLSRNVAATQALLEAAKDRPLTKLVYASSSSVYGDAEAYPTSETLRPRPISPYGVTKLAAEHLCELYRVAFAVPTVSLRLFTVYGPRQRPDMAFAKLMAAAAEGRVFELYGEGTQTRDFTFVSDVVRAMWSAANSDFTGVANIGGGARTSMNEVLSIAAELGVRPTVRRRPVQHGDVRDTAADTRTALLGFGYVPRVSLREGLAAMVGGRETAALAPAGNGL